MAFASSSLTGLLGLPVDQLQQQQQPQLDLGLSLDPGAAWCSARAASSAARASDDVAAPLLSDGDELQEEEEETDPLVLLMRKTLTPRASDAQPSSSRRPPLAAPRSTSYQAPGGPRETLMWAGNGAVWTEGVEVRRTYVFEPDEVVQAACFAAFDDDAPVPSSSSLDDSGRVAAAAVAAEAPRTISRPRARSRHSQTVPRGPRVSDGASFVRQSAHQPTPAPANRHPSRLSRASLGAPPPAPAASSSTSSSTGGRRTRALCFLFAESLVIHLASGTQHVLSLPCDMEPALLVLETGGVALRAREDQEGEQEVVGWSPGALYVVHHALDGLVLVERDQERAVLQHVQDARSTLPTDIDEGAQLRRLDPLVRSCLEALKGVLAEDELHALQSECAASNGRSSALKEAGGRFQAFEDRLLARLGAASSSIAPAVPSPSPWEKLSALNARSHDPAFSALLPDTSISVPTQLAAQPSALTSLDPSRVAPVLFALHLLAEDFKLDLLQFQHLRVLGELLVKLALVIGRRDWADYWFRQGCSMPTEGLPASPTVDAYLPPPPDIYQHLRAILTNKTGGSASWPVSKDTPPSLANTLIALYTTLRTISPHSAVESSAKVVELMVSRGITKDRLLRIPFGVALPLMAAVKTCQMAPSAAWSPAMFKLIRRPDLDRSSAADAKTQSTKKSEPLSTRAFAALQKAAKVDVATPPGLALRFGSDRRLDEVERLLSTTRTSTFKLRDEAGLTEQEVTAQQKNHAAMLAVRTYAIPVGQGMFNYSTSSAAVTSLFVIPPINTAVKTSWEGGLHAVTPPAVKGDTADWPEFSNGVAHALRIRPESEGVDSSWIVYNKPAELNPTHGGFLMGLGLAGHLRKMMPWHAFPYLDARHEPTSVGLLLGFAASHLGTADPLLTKIMSLHVHALLPHGSRELRSTSLVQAASLTGIGMLYLCSGNRRMADVALSEVSRSSNLSEEPPTDGRAYAFSAAMAFGMVMVGRGGESARSGDSLLVARLRTLIYGSATAAASDAQIRSKDVAPDLNVTSAPATLALGLMYLRTGREDIASMLEVPQLLSDLQVVRPDLLFSRTLARNLILWDRIADTKDWLESNIPPFILSHLGKRNRDGSSTSARQSLDLAHFNILAGACFALALKYAGTARSSVHSLLLSTYDTFYALAIVNASTYQQRVRLSAARSCLCVLALSLAIVMAGTGELSVLSRLRLAHGQHEKFGYGVQQALHMALGLLFLGKGMSSIGNSNRAVVAMVCAFFPDFNILPGDNDAYPQAFRHLWVLAVEPRCFVARDVEGGQPVYLPIKVKTEENGAFASYHLISPTLLPSFDRLVSVTIDSPRYWPLVLNLRKGKASTADKRKDLGGVLVKRRSGFLSYADDPKGNRTIFVKAGLTTGAPGLGSMSATPVAREGLQSLRESVAACTSDPFLLAFVRRFCSPPTDAADAVAAPSGDMQRFCESVLLECLVNDQPHLIALYLHVRLVSARSHSAPHLLPAVQMLNLQLSKDFAALQDDALAQVADEHRHPIAVLRPSFIRETSEAMTVPALVTGADTALGRNLRAYLASGTATLPPADQSQLALFLIAARVPSFAILSNLRDIVLEAREHLAAQTAVPTQPGAHKAILKVLLTGTLARLRQAGAKTRPMDDADLGWVDAALEVWR